MRHKKNVVLEDETLSALAAQFECAYAIRDVENLDSTVRILCDAMSIRFSDKSTNDTSDVVRTRLDSNAVPD
jgi:hypothetical protein